MFIILLLSLFFLFEVRFCYHLYLNNNGELVMVGLYLVVDVRFGVCYMIWYFFNVECLCFVYYDGLVNLDI